MADPEFLLLGDALWLEFVNTAVTPPGGRDLLPDPAAWQRWTTAVRLDPATNGSSYDEARRFRGQLLLLAKALTAGRNPPASAIEVINDRLGRLDGREHLVRVGGAWRVRFAARRPPSALEAVAQSVSQTLALPSFTIRVCANPECGLFLLDDTPGQGRRWCSSSRCGDRGKVERRRGTRRTPLVAEE